MIKLTAILGVIYLATVLLLKLYIASLRIEDQARLAFKMYTKIEKIVICISALIKIVFLACVPITGIMLICKYL